MDDEEKFQEQINQSRKQYEEKIESYSKRSGQPSEKWRGWAKNDKKFTAPEALELGIIDEIIQPVPLPDFKK